MPTGVVFDIKETKLIGEVAIENDALVIFNGAVDTLRPSVVATGKTLANWPSSWPAMPRALSPAPP